MTTVTHEIERKYELPGSEELPTLSDLADVATVTTLDPINLEATYYDTADLRLARQSVTLRCRSGGDDAGWHLKLPVGADERSELQAPLTGDDHPPAGLADMVRARTRGAALVPVARISTVRHRRRLYARDERLLAEVVDDRVTGEDLGADPSEEPAEFEPDHLAPDHATLEDSVRTPTVTGPTGSTKESWREIEVELGDGADAGVLDRVEQRLGEVGASRSSSSAKLTRVLAHRLPAPVRRPTAKPKGTAGDAVLAYLHQQFEILKQQDALARSETPDAVHQMRVAMRRMRSALQASKGIIDRPRVEDLISELRWAGQELGRARDLEVLHERFVDAVDGMPATLVIGPVKGRLTKYFARTEADAADNVRATLDGPRYFAMLDAFDAMLADPPLGEQAHRPARKQLPRTVRRTYRRVAERMAVADGLGPGEQREAALHEVRKAAKRVRYASEIAEPVIGKDAARYRKDAKAMTQLLGELQDSVLARPVLREIAVQAHLDGENGFTFGVLYGGEAAVAAAVEDELPAVWDRLNKPKRRKWLG